MALGHETGPFIVITAASGFLLCLFATLEALPLAFTTSGRATAGETLVFPFLGIGGVHVWLGNRSAPAGPLEGVTASVHLAAIQHVSDHAAKHRNSSETGREPWQQIP